MMEIDRREILRLALGLGMSITLPLQAQAHPQRRPFLCSAFTTITGEHLLGVGDLEGNTIFEYAVPSRGHAIALSPDMTSAAFVARRPGRWIDLIDLKRMKPVSSLTAPEGRHFSGHACYNAKGNRLYAGGNDYDGKRGVVTVYDLHTRRYLKEFPSYGLDPHELALMPDNTLVVANGGIETHPDFERIKLNLPAMDPSLAYIDANTGHLIEQVRPPHHQLSLRHLTLMPGARVIVGAQYEGNPTDNPPLVFMHQPGATLVPLAAHPAQERTHLNRYIASVTSTLDGKWIATSSPRGNRISLWCGERFEWIRDVALPDVAGIRFDSQGKQLFCSSGNGSLYAVDTGDWLPRLIKRVEHVQWDNHLT